MKYAMLIAMALMIQACSHNPGDECDNDSLVAQTSVNEHNKNILVIGDSLSIMWTPYMAAQLAGYNVYHTYCNSEGTQNLQAHLWSYLTYKNIHWDLVIYDVGDWNMPGNAYQESIPDYAAAVASIGAEIQSHAGATLFVTEPMVSANFVPVQLGPNLFNFSNLTVLAYDQAATNALGPLNIPVVDLYTDSQPIYEANDYDSSGIHFNAAGNAYLGNVIAQYVEGMNL